MSDASPVSDLLKTYGTMINTQRATIARLEAALDVERKACDDAVIVISDVARDPEYTADYRAACERWCREYDARRAAEKKP